MAAWHAKRSLSESSTGSEDEFASGKQGFKRPRASVSTSSSLGVGEIPFYERRESQASTASSTSFSVSESEDADGQKIR